MWRRIIGLALAMQFICGSATLAWDFTPAPGDRRETAQLNRACRNIQNSQECAMAVEKMQLPRYPQLVSRQGKTLRLTLKNGQVVELQDGSKGDDSDIFYQFRAFLPDLGYYLVHIQYFEGDAYLMVNYQSGERYTLHDLFLLSPNRQRLATVLMSEVHNPTAIQVWRINPEKMILEWSLEPKDWGPTDGAWQDNDTLTFSKTFYDRQHNLVRRGKMMVRQGPAGWKLSPQKP